MVVPLHDELLMQMYPLLSLQRQSLSVKQELGADFCNGSVCSLKKSMLLPCPHPCRARVSSLWKSAATNKYSFKTSVVNRVPRPFYSCHCWDDEVVVFSRVVVYVLEYVT